MATTGDGSPAPNLEILNRELGEERARVRHSGTVDRAWLQRTLRWLVEWAPEDDLTLIAALGRIARAVPSDLP